MRILVVLVLTAALAWAFLKLFPSSEEAKADNRGAWTPAARSDSSAGGQGERGAPAATKPASPTMDAAREDVRASAAANTSTPAWDSLAPVEWQLAAMVANGRLAEFEDGVRRAQGALPAPRAEALLAIAEALTGRREAALARVRSAAGAVSAREQKLLEIALGVAPFPVPERAAAPSPMERGLEMALVAGAAARAAEAGQPADAARLYSDLLLFAFDAPWEKDSALLGVWSEAVERAQERHRWNPRGEWPSFELKVHPGDSLVALRLRAVETRSDLHISTGLIARANGLRNDVIHPGDVLRVPTDPVSVRVDVASRWLLYMHGGEVVGAWQVGVGREGSETLTGDFVVGGKQKEPTWWPRGRSPVPFGDPENPLGTRWIAWRAIGESRDSSYGFHGTREPASIGHAASEGCIRMLNARVEALFEIVPVGAAVAVR